MTLRKARRMSLPPESDRATDGFVQGFVDYTPEIRIGVVADIVRCALIEDVLDRLITSSATQGRGLGGGTARELTLLPECLNASPGAFRFHLPQSDLEFLMTNGRSPRQAFSFSFPFAIPMTVTWRRCSPIKSWISARHASAAVGKVRDPK